MSSAEPAAALRVPLEAWAAVHPASRAALAGELPSPTPTRASAAARSSALAARLAETNRAAGNDVGAELGRWLAGAAAVVTGQQPGLLGGPLLTAVKAAAAIAEARRRRAAGTDAVAFLWLATADDDLAEMGWAALAVDEEVLRAREAGFARGEAVAGSARLGRAASELLEQAGERLHSEHARAAIELARDCYRPGATLGEATARFLGALFSGCGLIIVDALEPELARVSAPFVGRVLERLDDAWAALADAGESMRSRGWQAPLPTERRLLPVFRLQGERRLRLGAGEREVARAEIQGSPERFTPNVWLRPLVQDAALGTATALLGGAELAYHLQAAPLWEIAGVARPEWRLRPHVTVVTAGERRLIGRLRLEPGHLLRAHPPEHILPGRAARRQARELETALVRRLDRLAAEAEKSLPALRADLAASRQRMSESVAWLEQRIENAATRQAEVAGGRWQRVRAFLRPGGQPQERALSVLAPLLKLGTAWPAALADAIDPRADGMQLLYWGEGGRW